MRSSSVMAGQLNLFDLIAAATNPAKQILAMCVATREQVSAREPSSDELRLVPQGQYVVTVAGHPYVLQKTGLKVDDVQEGHKFFHYIIENNYRIVLLRSEKQV